MYAAPVRPSGRYGIGEEVEQRCQQRNPVREKFSGHSEQHPGIGHQQHLEAHVRQEKVLSKKQGDGRKEKELQRRVGEEKISVGQYPLIQQG